MYDFNRGGGLGPQVTGPRVHKMTKNSVTGLFFDAGEARASEG